MVEAVVIWGSGAIGGTIGAHLARAGQPVLFVDEVADHLAEIRAGRLRIEGPVAGFTSGGPTALPGEVTGRHRLVLLCVKAHHTEAAMRAILPVLAEDGAVVSCQNGLNELVIAEMAGRHRTVGAFVNFYADWLGPGRIHLAKRGAVVVGELDGARTPRIQALHAMLRDAFEPDAVLTDNIFGYLWGKAGYGAILKASALTDDSMGDFTGDPANRALIEALVREVLTVARAEGVRILGFDGFDPEAFLAGDAAGITACLDRLTAMNRASAKTHSGIWRDLAVRRRPTDVGAQLAPVRAAARRHGLATPIADRLVELVAAIEAGRAETGQGQIAELRALA
ncbi:MAG: ketopantoate reductase family protein [Acetobacteraceae bacterium]|nr:ketopantoate reductase family protein [Acetobacteraceae bacterium]